MAGLIVYEPAGSGPGFGPMRLMPGIAAMKVVSSWRVTFCSTTPTCGPSCCSNAKGGMVKGSPTLSPAPATIWAPRLPTFGWLNTAGAIVVKLMCCSRSWQRASFTPVGRRSRCWNVIAPPTVACGAGSTSSGGGTQGMVGGFCGMLTMIPLDSWYSPYMATVCAWLAVAPTATVATTKAARKNFDIKNSFVTDMALGTVARNPTPRCGSPGKRTLLGFRLRVLGWIERT